MNEPTEKPNQQKQRKRHGDTCVFTETRDGVDVLIIDISYRDTNNAKRRYRSRSHGQTVALAKIEEKRIQENIVKYGSPYRTEDKKVLSFADVAKEFLSDHVSGLKRSTQVGYTRWINEHLLPLWGEIDITEIDAGALMRLNAYGVEKKFAPTTRNNMQVIARSVLRFAKVRKFIRAVPDDLPRLRKHKRQGEAPEPQEVQRIMNAAKPSQRLCFGLMCYAGLRPSEVRSLRWRDVSDSTVQVNSAMIRGVEDTPKTGTGRRIPIDPRLKALLPERTGPDSFVCITKFRGGWTDTAISQAFKKIVRKLGLSKNRRLYDLRHYAITQWLGAGFPVQEVMRWAGHADLSTTGIYAHSVPGFDGAARLAALASQAIAAE